MNLEASKLAFLKEFLQLQSKEAVERLQLVLQEEKIKEEKLELPLIDSALLNDRIALSEQDFAEGRWKTQDSLVAKYHDL
jgi:hypothetical protein